MSTSTDAIKNSSKGAATGFSNGVFGGIISAFIGFVIVCIGFKVGWIFIVLGFIYPLISIFIGLDNFVQGECPYCNSPVGDIPVNNAIKCRSCKQQVIVRDNKFWTV